MTSEAHPYILLCYLFFFAISNLQPEETQETERVMGNDRSSLSLQCVPGDLDVIDLPESEVVTHISC